MNLRSAAATVLALVISSPALGLDVTTIHLDQPVSVDGLLSPAVNTLYLAEGWNGTRIHRADLQTGDVTVALTGLVGPIDVAQDTSGLLYSTCWGANWIGRGAEGGAAVNWTVLGLKPSGLHRDADGVLWTTQGQQDRIKRVDPDGSVTLINIGDTDNPVGITQVPGGDLYVAGLFNGVVYRVTTAGLVDSLTTVPGSGLYRIGHLEYAQGRLWATGLSASVIYSIDLDGTVAVVAGQLGVPGTADGPLGANTFTSPNGICVSADGTKLYITNGLAPTSGIRVLHLTNALDTPAVGLSSDEHLERIAPNPFDTTTRIEFAMTAAGPVNIDIVDVGGRRVRSLLAGTAPVGRRNVIWDGRGESGRPVASGSYFVRLRTGRTTETRRITLLR